MIFEIEHSGYTDPKLYDPMVQIVEKLNLKPLSHKEHNADYPKNSCWIDVLYDKERNVFVNITVYPESDHPDGYGKGRIIAKYLVDVTFENKADSQRAEEVSGLVRKIMEG